jgi:putative ABC transport system permease protein
MSPRKPQTGLVARLALRDFRHERILSACFVLALSAVLLPLLVLFGLKFGIIGNLLEPLQEDPRFREIRPVGSGSFDPAWFDAMAARADVDFIVPRTRSIAATMRLRSADSDVGRILRVELIPSAGGDPVLGALEAPSAFTSVVASVAVANKLGLAAGDRLQGIVSRTYQGERDTELLTLTVSGVAPAGAFPRDGLFVSQDLLVAVEDFRDGRAVPELGWRGAAVDDAERRFAGFRLYARDTADVADLQRGLQAQGIDVRTRQADIDLVAALDRNLGIVFWIIASIAALGYALSFGSSVWANVDRKQYDFSVLRLTGFRTRAIVWFPIIQAVMTALLGWAIASLAYFGVETGLNALLAETIGSGEPVCRLLPRHFLIALMMTLAAAGLAAALGGLRLARLEPSLALRAG